MATHIESDQVCIATFVHTNFMRSLCLSNRKFMTEKEELCLDTFMFMFKVTWSSKR